MADATGQAELREEFVSKVVKGFALQMYKMKQLCVIDNSSAWTESYYRETATELTGGTTAAVDGVPQLTNFPYGEPTWTKVSAVNTKHAMEGVVSYEDARLNNIDMISRTLLRIARAVASSVDSTIASAILSNAGNTVAANATWNNSTVSSRQPIQDILDAKAAIAIDNYDPDKNAYLLLHPTNFAELLGDSNVRNAGQFYTDAVTRNGVVGSLLGLTVISSNSITEGGAQVVIGKQACTWKQVTPLMTKVTEDPGISWTIRAWEMGQLQVTDTNAICSITGV